ncbi:MAG TPA: hypothetical protein VIQ29_25145 [Ancylobacter sp.]
MSDPVEFTLLYSWGLALKQLDCVEKGMRLDFPEKAGLGFDADTRDQLIARIDALNVALASYRKRLSGEDMQASGD